jgi:hypothetical protein
VNYISSQYDQIESEGLIILRNVKEQSLKMYFVDVRDVGEVVHKCHCLQRYGKTAVYVELYQ